MFRLVQLWLELASDMEINAKVARSFASVPSHKYLGLVYQMASRMSSTPAGPFVNSGFQVRLLTFIVHLLSLQYHHCGIYLSPWGAAKMLPNTVALLECP